MAIPTTDIDNALQSDSEESPVYQSQAMYYNLSANKWVNGTFSLRLKHLEFLSESAGNPPFHLALPLLTVSSIKKKNTCLVYAALLIEVGSEVHWFSSFPNRDSLYNLLELFWRDALLCSSKNQRITSNLCDQGSLGKRLLSILHESEDTLISTARALQEQASELLEIEANVEELNADLSSAEKLLSSMHKLPIPITTDNHIASAFNANGRMPSFRKKKYQVTYKDELSSIWKKSFLAVTSDNLQLLDEEDNLILNIAETELDKITVMSPWEFSISYTSGGEERHCSIMCPTLLQFQKMLQSIFGEKLINKNAQCEIQDGSSVTEAAAPFPSSLTTSSAVISKPQIPEIILQVQNAQVSGLLQMDEAQEIFTMLKNLHMLASEVTKEKKCQLEKIDKIITAMEKADIRINSDAKIMRKLS